MPTMPHHACSSTVSALLDVALQILQFARPRSVQNLVIGCNQQARVKKPSRMITVACLAFALWPFGVERGPGDGWFARRGAYEGARSTVWLVFGLMELARNALY